jgi:hypothetical protein
MKIALPLDDGETVDVHVSDSRVLRCVEAIWEVNRPDARWAAKVLSRHGHEVRHEADNPETKEGGTPPDRLAQAAPALLDALIGLLRACPLKADMAAYAAALDAVEAATGDMPGKVIFDASRRWAA